MKLNKNCLAFIALCLLSINLFGQQNGNDKRGSAKAQGERAELIISGQVQDELTKQALEFATVAIYSKLDTTITGGGITDENGKFSIRSKAGKLYAAIEYIGYIKKIIDPIEIDFDQIKAGNTNIDLGEVNLSTSDVLMDEVEIRAEKSETQFSLDKKVFNVGKDLANRGGTAQEILDNVPSVSVDIEGEVSLRGSGGVRILIDGKPSGYESNTNALKQIPANLIESVEVITNPSARYEAEGQAGIINIVTKKEKRSGFNGSFDLSGGFPWSAGFGANVNYRKDKLNFFANYGLNYRESIGGGTAITQQYLDSIDLITISDQKSDRDRSGLSNSIRFGIDYYLKENETITGAFRYRISDDNNVNTVNYADYTQAILSENLDSSSLRIDYEEEDESSLEYSLNYKKEFNNNRKHFLNINASYADDLEKEYSLFEESISIADGNNSELFQQNFIDEGNKQWLFSGDYVHPLGKDHMYEFGVKGSFRNINNNFKVEEMINSNWEELSEFTNNFIYTENIYAAYGQYGNRFNDFSFQVGLRGEYSDVNTELTQTGYSNPRTYFDLFPSAFLNYDIAEGNAIQVSYSRRVQRPRFFFLNPFITFTDRRSRFSGNPDLDPEYTNSYEVNYLRYWEKINISAGLFYRHSTDVVDRIRSIDENGIIFIRPENLNTRDDFGIDVNTSYYGIDWLRVDANITAYQSNTNGTNLDDAFSANAFAWESRLTSKFTFWKNADLQLRLNYRAPRRTVQAEYGGIASLDIGWTKDLLKSKKMSITFSARDVFNSRRRNWITYGPAIESTAGNTIVNDLGQNIRFIQNGDFQWMGRTFGITLSYRVNQKKTRQRSGGGYQGGNGGF